MAFLTMNQIEVTSGTWIIRWKGSPETISYPNMPSLDSGFRIIFIKIKYKMHLVIANSFVTTGFSLNRGSLEWGPGNAGPKKIIDHFYHSYV